MSNNVISPVLHFDDINGRPLVGGKLYSYIAGTSTPAPLYRDAECTDMQTNPVVLNMRGECKVFADPTINYKLVLKDKNDVIIYDWDGIIGVSGVGPIYVDPKTNRISILNGSIGRDLLKNWHNLIPDTRYLQFKDFGGNVVVTLCDALQAWLETEGYTP